MQKTVVLPYQLTFQFILCKKKRVIIVGGGRSGNDGTIIITDRALVFIKPK